MKVFSEGRNQQTIQTHNAVSVAASGSSNGAWVDTDGFDKLGLTLLNDGISTNKMDLYWSNNGVNNHGFSKDVINSSTTLSSAIIETRARYVKVVVVNGDSVDAHTMSAWAYLKA